MVESGGAARTENRLPDRYCDDRHGGRAVRGRLAGGCISIRTGGAFVPAYQCGGAAGGGLRYLIEKRFNTQHRYSDKEKGEKDEEERNRRIKMEWGYRFWQG